MKVTDKITITNEDNMALMARYPDNYFDLAIVDPPYGIGMDNSNKRTKPSRPNSYTDKYKDFRYHQTNWDDNRPTKQYFNELFRVSKNQIIWGANYFCEFLPSGFGWIFWNKLNGLENCFSDGEFAFSSKGVQSKYFECSTFHDLKGGKNRIHPTEKPAKLYKWLLKKYAKPNDKILDTHLGSMSIAIACADYGFELVGCELDKEYYEAGIKRVQNHIAQTKLF
jgi:site-specific DNA-methyltransferase (adenine-specific)